jgi:hypothetical protein
MAMAETMRDPLDQERAASAAFCIRERHHQSCDFWRGYCAAAGRLPGDVRYSGLLRALATVLKDSQTPSKPDERNGRLAVLADIAYWFNIFQRTVTRTGEDTFTVPACIQSGYQFINELIDRERREVQILQHESGEFLAWLKLLSAPHKPPRNTAEKGEGETGETDTEETTEKTQ